MCGEGMQGDQAILKLRDEGLLLSHEAERLMSQSDLLPAHASSLGEFDFDLATIPLSWSTHLIYRLFVYGNKTKGGTGINFPPPFLMKMLAAMLEARKGIENIEMMLTSPLPFPYVHLVCLMVHLSALFSSIKVGLLLGTEPELRALDVVFQMIFIFGMNNLYLGILSMGAAFANPLGNDKIDFPAAYLQQRLWKAQHFVHTFLQPDRDIDKEFEAMLPLEVERSGRKTVDSSDEEEEEVDEHAEGADDDDCDE